MVAGGLWENGEMATGDEFDALLVEAGRTPMRGWEYDYGGRIRLEPPPWDFPGACWSAAAASLLDMGTGGGEWLSRLPYRPPLTVATEGWAPNLEIARGAWSPWASAWSRWRARRTTIARAGRAMAAGVAVRRWHLRPGRQPPRVLSAIGGPAGAGARRLFSPSRWPATSTASSMRCSANRRRRRRRRTGTWVSPGPSWRPRSAAGGRRRRLGGVALRRCRRPGLVPVEPALGISRFSFRRHRERLRGLHESGKPLAVRQFSSGWRRAAPGARG